MDPLRPSLLESKPSSIQPNQVAQNILCGDTAPANGTDEAVVLTVLSAMFPLAFFVRAIWRDLPGKAAAGNGREVSGMGMASGVIPNGRWGLADRSCVRRAAAYAFYDEDARLPVWRSEDVAEPR
jgi:hypothetical protein